ncbi:hypothetical protein GPECTOR_17g935 [Gonium pectorale]|uniref:Protein kinase domain-containing protein n=1 Tax=Gonium pectorale TaxID=33097 RepID=A0A150GKC8_GONPE|nr:hypothetical protein GPECTOR_17g935 [Gonium pectorale]|eukprot:KXZ50296.1 hypothetical protein GPECTOR_17g935 [Gonium pectorale]
MRVVALLQELLGLTSERMQVSKVMALLCQRLGVSWACLTALSTDGEVFQHIGSAYALESRTITCSFSSCRTSSGLPGALGQGERQGTGRGPPSRCSSTNSIVGAGSIVEVGMSDPHMLRSSDTSIEAASASGQPLMLWEPAPIPVTSTGLPASLTTSASPASSPPGAPSGNSQPRLFHQTAAGPGAGAGPGGMPGQVSLSSPAGGPVASPGPGIVPVSAWPLDWQLLHREKGMRSFMCLPVSAANGSGTVIGCISFGSVEPMDWNRQFWASSTRLITGWAAGAITTTRATARASFYSRLCGAADLTGLARAFAYDMPVFLSDGAAGPGTALPEVRLALVSSRLQHAVVYAAPLLQVSGRLGLPPPGTPMSAAGSSIIGAGLGLGHGVGGGGGGSGSAAGGAAASGPSASAGSASSMAGVILYPMSGSGTIRLLDAERRAAPTEAPAGKAGGGPAGGPGSPPLLGDDVIECMVLGSTLDGEELLSCRSSSTAGQAVDSPEQFGGDPSLRPPSTGRKGSAPGMGSGRPSPAAQARNGGPPRSLPPPEAPPVDCVKINTDSTLLMSVLEAGDIMIIKDALQYFGGGRMVARDLALNNTRPATAGTLVILPLLHRCRSLGCVYVFARNEFNLSLSRAAWGDLAGMLSRAVFAQLVGRLRHEWYSVFSEEPPARPMMARDMSARGSHTGGTTGGSTSFGPGAARRVKRTDTGNSLGGYSGASSLRPSFDVPSRSAEQPYGGGFGLSADGGGSREEAARVLVAAAQVLEYAGFMPSVDGDDSVPGLGSRPPERVGSRHRIPPAHASVGSAEQTGSDHGTPTALVMPSTAVVAAARGGASSSSGAAGDRQSPSPGSLSFKLPVDIQQVAMTQLLPTLPLAVAPAAELGEPYSAVTVTTSTAAVAAVPPVGAGSLATGGSEEAACRGGRPPSAGFETSTTGASSGGEGGFNIAGAGDRALLRVTSPQAAAAAAAAAGAAAGPPGAGPTVIVARPVRATPVTVTVAGPGVSVATEELLPEEEVSGSSRELQGWPELVDILFDMHRTRNVSVYLAAYRGRPVAIKMMRSHMSMDGRPGHLDTEALTIAAQQQLSCVDHPNVLRVLMVYPLVYEVIAGGGGPGGGASKNARHGAGTGSNAPGALFLAAAAAAAATGGGGGGGGGAAAATGATHLNPLQPHGLGQGLGALHMQAHAMGDLLAGAGAADLPGGGVYLTAVLPRREKFKRGMALMLELFPSLSLREALQKRMLLPLGELTGGQAIGTGDSSVVAGPFQYATSQSALSDGPGTPTAAGLGAGGGISGGYPYIPQNLSGLPTLPEGLGSGEGLGGYGGGHTVDSSPNLALTAASNSGGNSCGGGGTGQGGGGPSLSLVVSILSQIAAGMLALHSAGLAHGELRPENVLLAMPSGARSHLASGQQERGGGGSSSGAGLGPATVLSGASDGMQRLSPNPRAPGANCGAALGLSGRGRSGGGGGGGGAVAAGLGGTSQSSSMGGGCGASLAETDRSTAPERPLPGRPITTDVIVKIKDAGMTVVGYSKGAQTVRKLLQRNRSAVLPFMPPEVHRGERFSRSADVYMFGILMWELYTGGVAFSNLAGTPIKLLQTVIGDGVRPPWPEGTPVWYQSLAARCWAGNAKQRPSFRRIVDKLAEVTSSTALAAAGALVAASWGQGNTVGTMVGP